MDTEREKMLQGQLYDPFDAELVAARMRARDLCQALNATPESQSDERRRIVRSGVAKSSIARFVTTT